MVMAEPSTDEDDHEHGAAFRGRLRGDVVRPGDPDYDRVAPVWNAVVDARPAGIVRCADAVDVAAALAFARAGNLPIAVRSGGHSLAGHGTCAGVVIDLSAMNSIDVDPMARTARIEPGLTWGEVATALQPYGLAAAAGDTASVGVGGLALGGGIGWLARKHGLTIDQVRSVELITVEGSFVRASHDEQPELFWGLRGGGGNFGIATAFELDLHPVGTVLGGAVFYDAADAVNILREYARLALAAPDELTTQAVLMAAPPAEPIPSTWRGRPVVAIVVCYAGDPSCGEAVVEPLRQLGTPIADSVAAIPLPAMFAHNAAGEVKGLRRHLRSLFVERVDDDLLRALVGAAAETLTSDTLIQLRGLGGAMARVAADATAFAHRDKPFMLVISTAGPLDGQDALRKAQTERVWQAVRQYAAGVYVNFLADEGESRVREAYPPATWNRLAALKARYDPTNVLRLNQNIPPALPA